MVERHPVHKYKVKTGKQTTQTFSKNLSICTKEPKAGSFSSKRICLAIQIANAACVLGTTYNKRTFDEMFSLYDLYIIFSRVKLRVLIEET